MKWGGVVSTLAVREQDHLSWVSCHSPQLELAAFSLEQFKAHFFGFTSPGGFRLSKRYAIKQFDVSWPACETISSSQVWEVQGLFSFFANKCWGKIDDEESKNQVASYLLSMYSSPGLPRAHLFPVDLGASLTPSLTLSGAVFATQASKSRDGVQIAKVRAV